MSWLTSLFGGGSARIDGARARELMAAGAQLVDVRTPGEFGGGHIPDAVNIPVDQLAGRLGELNKSRVVVLYCASGARSARAKSLLERSDFTEVHDLGGMRNW